MQNYRNMKIMCENDELYNDIADWPVTSAIGHNQASVILVMCIIGIAHNEWTSDCSDGGEALIVAMEVKLWL